MKITIKPNRSAMLTMNQAEFALLRQIVNFADGDTPTISISGLKTSKFGNAFRKALRDLKRRKAPKRMKRE